MNRLLATVLAAATVVGLFSACSGSSTSEEDDYMGTRMNKKLMESLVETYTLAKEDPELRDMWIDGLGELVYIQYRYHDGGSGALINERGEVVLEGEELSDLTFGNFSCGISRLEFSGTVGYMNENAEMVVAPGTYIQGTIFWHDVAAVCTDYHNWGIIRKDGSLLFPTEYEKADVYPNGLILLGRRNQNDTYEEAVYTSEGKEVMPFQPNLSTNAPWGEADNELYLINDVIFAKTEKDGYYCIYGDGKMESLGKFYRINGFKEHGIARVDADFNSEKCGFVNTKGKLIVPCEYGHVRTLNHGLVMFDFAKNKCGAYDFEGNLLWPFEYDDIYSFNQDLACVKQGEQWYVINHDGKKQAVESSTSVFGKAYQTNSEDGRQHGLATLDGKVLLEPTHSYFEEILNTRLVCASNDEEYYNYDTGERVLGDGYTIDHWFDNGFGKQYETGVDSKGNVRFSNDGGIELVGPDGKLLPVPTLTRIGGDFYVDATCSVYYRDKKIGKVGNGLLKTIGSGWDKTCGNLCLDGMYFYASTDEGDVTVFVNKKGIVTKVKGIVDKQFGDMLRPSNVTSAYVSGNVF
ncbi:MAG: WG repeat-containing protein [Bacteroidaceae bacterium]|nr:WG repeat-containing protein [Bacteroidaceae bacterium]